MKPAATPDPRYTVPCPLDCLGLWSDVEAVNLHLHHYHENDDLRLAEPEPFIGPVLPERNQP